MTAKKSSNPMYPDAHPTAPGGMSRKALIRELIDIHGYEEGTKEQWGQVSWPDLIDLVVEGRLEQEAEAEAEAEDIEPEAGDDQIAAAMFEDEGPEDEPADEAEVDEFDALLAEFEDDEVLAPSTEADPIREAVEAGATYAEADAAMEDGILDPESMFAEMTSARATELAENPPLFMRIPGVRDYIFDGHAGAGPSGAERWMNCTMSLTASGAFLETLTPRQQAAFAVAGTAAQQGTTAHSVGEAEANHLLGRITVDELDTTLLELAANPIDEDTAYDDEMAEYVSEYVALVQTYATERGADSIFIERRVEAIIPLTDEHDDEMYVIRGSLDFGAMPTPEHNALVVGDLKYGKGIEVDVDENPQIRLYAIGILSEMADEEGNLPDIEEVVYYIAQPRLGGIKEWRESVDDLLTWRDEVLAPALTKALYGEKAGATFAPSDLACQWCPARGGCPALADLRLSQAEDLFTVVLDAEVAGAPINETTLANDRLGDLLLQARQIEGLAKSLREEAQRRLHRGESVKNFTLVSYTPARSWKSHDDPIQVVQSIKGLTTEEKRALFRPRALVTPAMAEKILGEKFAAASELIDTPDKRPVISTGPGDRRKVWTGKAPEDMFADEGDE